MPKPVWGVHELAIVDVDFLMCEWIKLFGEPHADSALPTLWFSWKSGLDVPFEDGWIETMEREYAGAPILLAAREQQRRVITVLVDDLVSLGIVELLDDAQWADPSVALTRMPMQVAFKGSMLPWRGIEAAVESKDFPTRT